MAKKVKSRWPTIVARHDPDNDSIVFDISGIIREVPLLGSEALSVLVHEVAQLATTLARGYLTITFLTKTEKRILTIKQSGEVTAGAGAARKHSRKQPAFAVAPRPAGEASWQEAIDSTRSTPAYVTWGQVTSTKEELS